MAYHLYHTEGIVLGAKDTGESNRVYFILTRDLGLVGAVAQGVRELKSKLRGHLTLGCRARMTFVRGRDVWRLTSAEEMGRIPAGDRTRLHAGLRMAELVRRLVHGEERDAELYDEMGAALEFVCSPIFKEEYRTLVETVFAVRILARLGYGAEDEAVEAVLAAPWGVDLLALAQPQRNALVRMVNDALRASHL